MRMNGIGQSSRSGGGGCRVVRVLLLLGMMQWRMRLLWLRLPCRRRVRDIILMILMSSSWRRWWIRRILLLLDAVIASFRRRRRVGRFLAIGDHATTTFVFLPLAIIIVIVIVIIHGRIVHDDLIIIIWLR